MLSNTISGFIFTSLHKISNRKRLLVLHVFCDYFDLVFSFSFYEIYKYTKIYTKIPTNKTANNDKKLKKY